MIRGAQPTFASTAGVSLVVASLAGAQTLPSTPYACNIETPVITSAFKGDVGTTAFFDIVVGDSNIEIRGVDAASTSGTLAQPAPLEIEVYTIEGASYAGLENDPSAWTLAASGAGLATGVIPGGPTGMQTTAGYIELDRPIHLSTKGRYAFAVLYVQGRAGYWNGNGPNQLAQTSELTFEAGTVTLAPFAGSVFAPRVWGGRLHYINCEASCVCDRFNVDTGVGACDIFDFLAFQDAFTLADPLACDMDTSTGQGVCDVFDFLAFQDAFTIGCP